MNKNDKENNLIQSAIDYMNSNPLPKIVKVELDNGKTYDISGYVGDIDYTVDDEGKLFFYNKLTDTVFNLDQNSLNY